MNSKHRPDIDGLRAVAVLSVLLFHGGFESFSGGFVGVDVFFVISGYLITSIILREIVNGRFSISDFYERRIRRIFPALFVVVAASLVIGAIVLSPIDFRTMGQSVVATIVFASNMFFWSKVGYFDGPADSKPLLHTWSLAVEEQYYLLFPLVLILITRHFRSRYAFWLAACAFASFTLNLYATTNSPAAAFYWAPMRAWELMVGGIIALGVLPELRGQWSREFLSGTGLVLVFASFFAISRETPFPGTAALAPVFGTALLIYGGGAGHCRVSRVLATRPLAFVGLVSYSLYLWHWPLLVLAQYLTIRELTKLESTSVLLLSFVMAVLSWRFVETPLRNRQFLRPKTVFIASGAAISGLLAIGLSVHLMDGAFNPNSAAVYGAKSSGDPDWTHWGSCQSRADSLVDGLRPCSIGPDQNPKALFLWGDSHARAVAPAIAYSAEIHGIGGFMATKDACPPLLGVQRAWDNGCARFNESVLAFIAANPAVKTVVLSARWVLSSNGSRYGDEEGASVRLLDIHAEATRVESSARESNQDLFTKGIERTVTALRSMGRRVVLVGQVPEVGYDVPAAFQVSRLTGRDVNNLIAPTVAAFEARRGYVQSVFSSLGMSPHVLIVEPATMLCGASFCSVANDDYALYRDDNHLSTLGAYFVSAVFDGLLSET